MNPEHLQSNLWMICNRKVIQFWMLIAVNSSSEVVQQCEFCFVYLPT